MAAAAAVPWKEIYKALPVVVTAAERIWEKLASKPTEPAVDSSADLRAQVGALRTLLQEQQAAQAEQAKVVAQLAEQLQAIARRSARAYWLGVAGLGLGCLALVITWTRF
jgi:hypothetical protein